jgi:hypothetical protein
LCREFRLKLLEVRQADLPRLLHGRNCPGPVQQRGRVSLESTAQHQDERVRGSRHPIGLFVLARIVVLRVKVDRAVGVFLELVVGAQCVAVERIPN